MYSCFYYAQIIIQIPERILKSLPDVPQWEQNDLANGPTPTICNGNNIGLITKVDVAKGSILCLKKGIVLNDAFLNYSDYDVSNITLIKPFSGGLTSLMDNFYQKQNYCEYIKDPLDPKKSNAEYIELKEDNSIVVVKATENIRAYNEILVSG